MAKEKKEKKPKEKKAKPEKGKKGKKDEVAVDEEGGGGGGGKKKIILLLLLLIIGGGAGCAYFLVYLPMTEGVEGEEEEIEVLFQLEPATPTGHYGYLSYNPDANNQLFIDDVYVIKANETQLIEEWNLDVEQMEHGYYISNPLTGLRDIYVDQGTSFTIISRETGKEEAVNWSAFINHIANSSILCEIQSYNNILTSVKEFPVNDFSLPEIDMSDLPAAQEIEEPPAEEIDEEEIPPEEESPVEETPAEVPPVEETPAEAPPVEETPAEAPPVEELPAEAPSETPTEAVSAPEEATETAVEDASTPESETSSDT